MRHLPLLALLAACGDAADDAPDTDVVDTDVAPPTFEQVRNEVLAPSCAFSVCHGSGTGGLELDGSEADHARLVGVESPTKAGAILVVPGDPDASYLVQKLEGTVGIVGERMPSGGELEAERIQLVKDWIAAGALDD